MYQATFGVLINGFDNDRPTTPVRILSFNCRHEGILFVPYLEKVNASGTTPIEINTPIKKDLEELVGDHENRQYSNQEYKDHFHELDWVGRCYRYIGPGRYLKAFPPYIVTSNPYWMVKEHWEEIAMYQLKEELNFSVMSFYADQTFKSGCEIVNRVLGNGYAR